MKIDIFNHVFPKKFFDKYIISGAAGKEIGKRMANATVGFDLDYRFRVLDEFGDVRQVITLGQPPIEALGGPAESPVIAREANDGLAELVAKHPDRFIAFAASMPLNNVDAMQQVTCPPQPAVEHGVPGCGQLVQELLKPQLVHLVDRDEQQLVVCRR